jgi:hypothetical protein
LVPILKRHIDLAAYPAKRPQPPYKDAKGWHCSVYYFWWAFLKESAEFRSGQFAGTDTPEGRVGRYFRDVGTMNFPNWWINVGRLQIKGNKGSSRCGKKDQTFLNVPSRKILFTQRAHLDFLQSLYPH